MSNSFNCGKTVNTKEKPVATPKYPKIFIGTNHMSQNINIPTHSMSTKFMTGGKLIPEIMYWCELELLTY